VRHWFREQGRDQAVSEGRALLDRELSRLELRKATPATIASALGLDGTDALHAAIGYGDRSIQAIVALALDLERGRAKAPDLSSKPPPTSQRNPAGLSLDGVPDVLGSRAHCCNPLPGDDVLGFVTRGRGITIHRRDCANVRQSLEPERWVEIGWGKDPGQSHSVGVEVVASSSSGLLSRLVRLLTHMGVIVSASRLLPSRNERVRLSLTLQTQDAEHLSLALQRVSSQHDVETVRIVSH
jgi:GTP pyrophosphokinase